MLGVCTVMTRASSMVSSDPEFRRRVVGLVCWLELSMFCVEKFGAVRKSDGEYLDM